MTYEITNSFHYLTESNHNVMEYNLPDYNSYTFGSPTYSAFSSSNHSAPHSILDDDIPEMKAKNGASSTNLFEDIFESIKTERESSLSPLPESSLNDIQTNNFITERNPLLTPPYISEHIYSSHYNKPSPSIPSKTRTSLNDDDESTLDTFDSQSIIHPYYYYSLPPLTCYSSSNYKYDTDFPFAYNPNQSMPYNQSKKYHHHHHHHHQSSLKTRYVQNYENVLTTAPRRYKCILCIKRFTRPSSLATHMHSHTGEKPYQCEVNGCGRRFSVVSNLRRHAKIHLQSSVPLQQ